MANIRLSTKPITRHLQSCYCSFLLHIAMVFFLCLTIFRPVTSTDDAECSIICSYNKDYRNADCTKLDLTRIPPNAGLCSMATHLDLERNDIQVVEQYDLVEYTSVQVLLLGYNKISQISADMCGNATNLRQLQLNNNKIRSVPNEAFRELHSLTALHLDNNVIEELQPGAFDGLSSLERLFLNDNSLSAIPHGVFRDLRKLTLLNINSNKIMTLSGQSFAGLKQLERLSLDNNGLTSVDLLTFQGLSLKMINLVNNNITTVKNVQEFLDQATNLTSISLSGNPLNCSCNVEPLRKWLRAKESNDDSTCVTPADFKGKKLTDIDQNLCDYSGPVEGFTSPKYLETTQQHRFSKVGGVGTGGSQKLNSDDTWKIVIIVCVGFLVVAILVGALIFIGRRRGGQFHHPNQSPNAIHYSSVRISNPIHSDHHRTRMSSENSETMLMGHDAYESYTIPPDARQNRTDQYNQTGNHRPHHQVNGHSLRGDRAPLVKQSSTGSATTSPDIVVADSARDDFSSPERPGERPVRFSISEPTIPEVELEFDSDGHCTTFGARVPNSSDNNRISTPPRHPPPPPPPSTQLHTPVGTNTGYLPLPNLQKV